MKIKTLPQTFRRARFDWEIVERREVWPHYPLEVKHFGLFRQDKHWAVALIKQEKPHYRDKGGWDLVERMKDIKTYMPNEEHLARKEYESK